MISTFRFSVLFLIVIYSLIYPITAYMFKDIYIVHIMIGRLWKANNGQIILSTRAGPIIWWKLTLIYVFYKQKENLVGRIATERKRCKESL